MERGNYLPRIYLLLKLLVVVAILFAFMFSLACEFSLVPLYPSSKGQVLVE